MKPTRIGIVDDHAIFRQGLRKLFADYPEFSVVGEASNGREAIEFVNKTPLDILLLDLQLGDMTGLDVLRQLGTDRDFCTILLGADIHREDEINAILLGASGIVRKYAAAETLFKSIHAILDGEVWLNRDVVKDLVGIVRGPRAHSTVLPSGGRFELTPREMDIVNAVVTGLGNREISDTLGISPFTVKHYLTRIFTKLNVTNRVELVLLATRSGFASQIHPASSATTSNER